MSIKGITGNQWSYNIYSESEEALYFYSEMNKNFRIPQQILKVIYNRGIKDKISCLKYLSKNKASIQSPFFFSQMAEAVNIINNAMKNNLKIALYGDSDVDGIFALTILKNYFDYFNYEVMLDIPKDSEGYGLQCADIDEFIKKGIDLVITVDNGISSFEAVEKAKKVGIKTIITDHHISEGKLPNADVIINPKVEDDIVYSNYSGCGVAYKLVEACMFSKTRVFNDEFVLINMLPFKWKNKKQDKYYINLEITNIKKLQIDKVENYSIEVNPDKFQKNYLKDFNSNSVYKLGSILNNNEINKILKNYFDKYILTYDKDFFKYLLKYLNYSDISNINIKEFSELINNDNRLISYLHLFKNKYLLPGQFLYSIFYSLIRENYKKINKFLEKQLHLVSIATIADIMPLEDENRNLVTLGLRSLNSTLSTEMEVLINSVFYLQLPVSSEDVVWKVSPILNSPGRFGKGELILDYFTKENIDKVDLFKKIISYNNKRTSTVEEIVRKVNETSNNNSNVILYEIENFESGLSGLLASKFASNKNKPAIVLIKNKDKYIGSMRTMDMIDGYSFLEEYRNYFKNFGGHHAACGFTIKPDKYDAFRTKLINKIQNVTYSNKLKKKYDVEIMFDDFNKDFFKWYEKLEPFGEGNSKPIFYTEDIIINNLKFVGRDNTTARFIVGQGNTEFNAVFFKSSKYLKDLKKKNIYAVVYEFQKQFKTNCYELRVLDLLTLS